MHASYLKICVVEWVELAGKWPGRCRESIALRTEPKKRRCLSIRTGTSYLKLNLRKLSLSGNKTCYPVCCDTKVLYNALFQKGVSLNRRNEWMKGGRQQIAAYNCTEPVIRRLPQKKRCLSIRTGTFLPKIKPKKTYTYAA